MALTVLIPLVVILLFLVAFLLFRTALYSSDEERVEPAPQVDVDTRLVAEHLGRLVRCETVSSHDPEKFPKKAFRNLHKEMEMMYPRIHRHLDIEVVSDYSLLYTWHGSNLDLKPLLLMAHQDVVPVDGQAGGWERPPFSGDISDGFVWGRGTLDDKNNLAGILEAVEMLIQEGFAPQRTIYLAFGHDEELGGSRGSACIANILKERGEALQLVVDEGGMLSNGILPAGERTVALIGVAEKKDVLVELRAEAEAGHSSAPGKQNAIGRLAEAIARLAEHPMPARLDAVQMMFAPLASELPFGMRFLLANRWLLGGILKRVLSRTPSSNAMIRTTLVATMLKGGIKENIIPGQASAAIDARLMPGDDIAAVFAHIRKTVGEEGLLVRPLYGETMPEMDGTSYSMEESQRGLGYQVLAQTIREMFPETIVAPYLVAGCTDSRYFQPFSEQVLRFSPVRFTQADISRVHGANERLGVKACGDLVRFYRQLILNAAG